jgi:hypothetical protein
MNLSWKGGDPDGDNVTYDVYFGEHPMNLSKRVTNQSHLWWKPPLLNFQQTYFWQIIAWDQYGYESVGPVWHFTTEPNYPPDKAFNPFPEDGESVVPIDVILAWNGSDPNIGDSIKFDVYFDDVYPPVQRTFNQTENFYDPYGQQNLSLYKTYYWKIVTWDSKGLSSVGDIWNFTTGLNHKPTNPQINGPNKGTINIEYEFTFVSTDQDNHTIKYYIDWDDEDSIETEYYESGEVVKLSHSWEEEGTYIIKARAEDKLHTKSEDWSEFQFKAPRNKVLNYKLLEILFERFPYLYLLFENLLKIF